MLCIKFNTWSTASEDGIVSTNSEKKKSTGYSDIYTEISSFLSGRNSEKSSI